VLTGNWQALYDEMREMRAACGEAHVKAILATGELQTLRNVARASLVCMMAGADFIKTSTGKESRQRHPARHPDDDPRHPRL
jgi:deoxyribose-phosphate aldolase